jgi:hypothetical protein
MAENFDISRHDALFASRMTANEWQRILAFRNLPDFLAGIRTHEGAMLPFFTRDRFINKLATEEWRFQMIVFTLYLHETRIEGDPRTGLSVSNFQRVTKSLKLASAGRAYAFLNIMKLAGYLSSDRDSIDARVIRLAPTPLFLGIVEEWNNNIFAAIDAADPESQLLQLSQRHPDLGRKMRTSGAEEILDGWVAMAPFPEVHHFAAADGGWMLMESIISASLHGTPPTSIESASLNLRECAHSFGGSRTNLKRLLDRAYDLGLLDFPAREGAPIRFSSVMICSFLTFMASFLGTFQRHSRIGLKILEAQAA